MASIQKYVLKDGTIKYRAMIVIKKEGLIIHRESKTFNKQKLAKDWGQRREVEIQTKNLYKQKDRLPLTNVIDKYIQQFNPTGRSKLNHLKRIQGWDIARFNVHTLTAKDLIDHVQMRNQTVTPQTAYLDLIWIRAVVNTMRSICDIDSPENIFTTARNVLNAEHLIANPEKRERRPTRHELWQLSRYFQDHYMLHIMWFAIYSARRQKEITELLWSDINHDKKTGIVRNLKDPLRRKLKKTFKIPRSAYKIICRQPQNSPRIFPYNHQTIQKKFTKACQMLEIKNLRFHDLRHEATSRYFEAGLTIQQVQQITLHGKWTTLQRYCNIDPGDLDI